MSNAIDYDKYPPIIHYMGGTVSLRNMYIKNTKCYYEKIETLGGD